jgi:hypothetical protein
MLKDMLWWTKYVLKRILVFGALVAAGWYTLNYSKTPFHAVSDKSGQNVEKKVIDVYEVASRNLTAEQKQQLEEIGLGKGAMTVEVITPKSKLDKALNQGRQVVVEAETKYEKALGWLSAHMAAFSSFLKVAFTILILAMLSLRSLKLWEPLRISSLLLLKASNIFLVLSSVAALVMTFGFNVNVWKDTDLVIFWLPAGLLAAGALGTWSVDENFPIWKTIYTGMSFPIVSGVGIIIKNIFL